jgi:hypothetical protein
MTTPAEDAAAEAASLALVQAAFADGMRVNDERQSHIAEPMGGAVPWSAQSTQQPYVGVELGAATESGVT